MLHFFYVLCVHIVPNINPKPTTSSDMFYRHSNQNEKLNNPRVITWSKKHVRFQTNRDDIMWDNQVVSMSTMLFTCNINNYLQLNPWCFIHIKYTHKSILNKHAAFTVFYHWVSNLKQSIPYSPLCCLQITKHTYIVHMPIQWVNIPSINGMSNSSFSVEGCHI